MSTITTLGIGSGLDLNGLLDQLESAERERLIPISVQKNSAKAKISAYGQLKSALSQLQTAAEKLSGTDVFQGVKANVAGDSVTAASGATTPAGSFQVDVTQLARAYSIATTGIADQTAELGAGTITLTLGNGDVTEVDISAEDSSLESIRNAINSSDAGVTASIVNDGSGSPYRLVLSSSGEGTDGAIASIDFGDLGATLVTDAATEITAQNASLTVNGISIISQTNQVEDAIQGATLTLVEEGSSTVQFNRDTPGISGAIEKFVTAYNKLHEIASNLTRYEGEDNAVGELMGDSTMRGIQGRLSLALSNNIGSGTIKKLTDVGITLELGGALELDKDVLYDLVENQGQALTNFFAGLSGEEGGFADELGEELDQMVDSNGLLENATVALEADIKRYDRRYDQVEERIDSTVERYRIQFGQLDGLISRMNSTSGYLAQQFDMMSTIGKT